MNLLNVKFIIIMLMLLLLLSRFSHVLLFVTPQTITARLLCPCNFPKKVFWIAISSSRGSSQTKDWTQVPCISCIDRLILYHYITWKGLMMVVIEKWTDWGLVLQPKPQDLVLHWMWRIKEIRYCNREEQLLGSCYFSQVLSAENWNR